MSIKKIKRIKGWLTNKDIETLRDASIRKPQYKKEPAQKFKCQECDYDWSYACMKCPICSSEEFIKL